MLTRLKERLAAWRLRFIAWRVRSRHPAEHQLEHLRTIVAQDHRWLAHDTVADTLTGRYLSALAPDWYVRTVERIEDLRQRIGLDPHAGAGRWTCFHCGETFTTRGSARAHFGGNPDAMPGCMAKVELGGERGLLMALRKVEDELAQLYRDRADEDTPLHREMWRLQSRHSDALSDAEQTGYARGLVDARKHPEVIGLPAAWGDVLAERRRHVDVERWTPEHDDDHDAGELAAAGAAYSLAAADVLHPLSQGDGGWTAGSPPMSWPWDSVWWKPGEPRRMLVKAGALILAEIERIDRAQDRTAVKAAATVG